MPVMTAKGSSGKSEWGISDKKVSRKETLYKAVFYPFCTAINPSTRNGMPVMTAKGSSGKSEWGISDKKVSLKTMTLNNEKHPFCTAINPSTRNGMPVMTAKGSSGKSEWGISDKKVSLKTMTLNNEKQKVNDELGNPVEIGAVVIWKVIDPTKAMINVENYKNYLSIQCDAIIRNTARCYPYDTSAGGDEKSLRGSSQEIADIMCKELQKKVEEAGIQIQEVRITHLAYAPEIASAMLQRQQAAAIIDARQKIVEGAMLQRQQAAAIIDARQKIVEGAVGMVEMALERLSEKEVVELDEERKAAMVSNLLVVLCGNKDAQPIVNAMVSNLLVVLCGNKDAQPIVNSGSLY